MDCFQFQKDFIDEDQYYGQVMIDRYIDRMHQLLQDGFDSDARLLSLRINDIVGVSSSVG